MIKEELEKEAEELIQRVEMGNSMNCLMQLTPDRKQIGEMLVMIAEPREKRIVDLESTNKKISDECHKLVNTLEKKQNKNELLETQNIKLQAEVSRLTIENAELEAIVRNTKAVDESFALQTIQLTKAKDLLKKLSDVYSYVIQHKEYADREILKQVEQFLKESEVNNALS